ncbi:hypothetical protein [Methanococcoides sp. FTZ1]|uniref:hypothetical protein n=1 Tax=Methanococcoides sp. FTZ1 TaxID=3439061 RepID=UPI003F85B9E5
MVLVSLEVTLAEAQLLETLRTSDIRQHDEILKMHRIHTAHTEHPEYNVKELAMATGDGERAVRRYWKKFVTQTVAVIRPWNEVMS